MEFADACVALHEAAARLFLRRPTQEHVMLAELEQFEGLAEPYLLYRPEYPRAALEDLVAVCTSDCRIAVDVGAGPGTSTAPLRAALPDAWLITAVEPGMDMRRVLARKFDREQRVQVVDGQAEALPLPDACAGLVVACSAYHRFDSSAFFAEVSRIMAPGGVLGLLCNRLVPCPLVEALDTYVAETAKALGLASSALLRLEPTVRELSDVDGFKTARSKTYVWSEMRDRRALIDLYLTRSNVWILVRKLGLGQVMRDLSAVCEAYWGAETTATLDWQTTVKWTQRR